jgi:hypothetical protein
MQLPAEVEPQFEKSFTKKQAVPEKQYKNVK